MKRYLLVGIAVLFVSANASLEEDFAEMDLEQEQLLNDMRKSLALSGEEDEMEEVEEDTVVSEKTVEPGPVSEEKVAIPSPESTANTPQVGGAIWNDDGTLRIVESGVNEGDSEENEDDSEERADIIRQKAMAEAKEKDEAQKASAAKEEALKTAIDAKAAEIKKVKEAQEKAAAEQRAAEKREVEAYEKQRADKLAQEVAKKEELEKKQLAQKALDEAAAKEKSMEKLSVEDTKEADIVTPTQEVTAVGDVNIERELEEQTQVANDEYENAVKEMQEED